MILYESIIYFYLCTFGTCQYQFFYAPENPIDNFLIIDSLPLEEYNQQYWCTGDKVTFEEYNSSSCENRSRGYSSKGEYHRVISKLLLDDLTVKHLTSKADTEIWSRAI